MSVFEITMDEVQSDGSIKTITQTAVCRDERQVIDFYGLYEPDIVRFNIKKL